MAEVVYTISNIMMKGVLRAFAHWRVEGRENVPFHGPLIVVSNHLSNVDPPLLACSLPRRLHYLAKRNLFKPIVGVFLRAYGVHPLNLDGRDIGAIRWAQRCLKRDGAVVLFPESHRNPFKGMQKGLPGAALLALWSQAPILPVGITGTERLGPLWRVAFPTGEITVRIGRPFSFPPVEGRVAKAQVQSLADMIMFRVAELLPERYRGIYQFKENPAPPAARG